MTRNRQKRRSNAFSLVEVVLAIGIVSASVLITFGLLSVAGTTNKNARDEGFAARLAANEFDRIRSLSASNFPSSYIPQYYDSDLNDLGQSGGTPPPTAVYKISISFVAPSPAPSPQVADWIVNADVAYPALAPTPNQSVYHYTTLMNIPIPTPSP